MRAEKYVTDEAVQAAAALIKYRYAEDVAAALAAALPGILAQHTRDVLRGAAREFPDYEDVVHGNPHRLLNGWADEAVAE